MPRLWMMLSSQTHTPSTFPTNPICPSRRPLRGTLSTPRSLSLSGQSSLISPKEINVQGWVYGWHWKQFHNDTRIEGWIPYRYLGPVSCPLPSRSRPPSLSSSGPSPSASPSSPQTKLVALYSFDHTLASTLRRPSPPMGTRTRVGNGVYESRPSPKAS